MRDRSAETYVMSVTMEISHFALGAKTMKLSSSKIVCSKRYETIQTADAVHG